MINRDWQYFNIGLIGPVPMFQGCLLWEWGLQWTTEPGIPATGQSACQHPDVKTELFAQFLFQY